ncbi:MAG: peptidase domain-containing ABC transporter [Burkholderiales bacterium]|nr:peptidase domain-containing ABC transporter [Burkholderiales bacterium]
MSATSASRSTALECLSAVARHHGIDLAPDRLRHDFALAEGEPSTDTLVRIAHERGLKARAVRLDWDALRRQPAGAFPLLLRLANGNCVVALGFRSIAASAGSVAPVGVAGSGAAPPGSASAPGADPELVVADPLADGGKHLPLDRERLGSAWAGEAVLIGRAFALSDESQPFGLRWFVPALLRERSVLRDVALAALALHVVALGLPIFFQIVIDKVLAHQSYSTLYVLAAGVVLCLLFEAVFGFLRQYLLLYATSKIDMRLSARVFSHLMALPVVFFERVAAGVLVQHVQQARRVREFLTGRLFVTLLDASVLVVFIPVLFFYSPKLTGILLAFCLAIACAIGLVIVPFRNRLLRLYQAEAARQGLLVESIHGMGTIKALALEPRQRRDWEEKTAQAVDLHFRVGRISALAHGATSLLDKLMLVAIIVVGAIDVFAGALSVGALVAFQMLSGRVSGPLVQLVSLIHEYQETALSVRMLGEVMNRPPETPAGARGLRVPLAGGIMFENVVFSYVPGQRVIDNVSFNLPPGTMIGVVGRSGSGKTTLARLIQGLYPVQEGVIRLDGQDAREIDQQHLRSSIGVVLQETFLFKGTVRDNIAVSRPDATREQILAAAHASGAAEFVERLPQGMDTVLEEGATNLSGGQKQRLAIARALLRDPRILIFDEATSALDPESENVVRRNLAAMRQGRTVVMITHRLTSLTGADAILVMDRGRIVGYGSHAELVQRPGLYQELWRQQTSFVA